MEEEAEEDEDEENTTTKKKTQLAQRAHRDLDKPSGKGEGQQKTSWSQGPFCF